jgi:hypothetical protein
MAHPPNWCDSRLRVNSEDFFATSWRTLTASAMTSGPVAEDQINGFKDIIQIIPIPSPGRTTTRNLHVKI